MVFKQGWNAQGLIAGRAPEWAEWVYNVCTPLSALPKQDFIWDGTASTQSVKGSPISEYVLICQENMFPPLFLSLLFPLLSTLAVAANYPTGITKVIPTTCFVCPTWVGTVPTRITCPVDSWPDQPGWWQEHLVAHTVQHHCSSWTLPQTEASQLGINERFVLT